MEKSSRYITTTPPKAPVNNHLSLAKVNTFSVVVARTKQHWVQSKQIPRLTLSDRQPNLKTSFRVDYLLPTDIEVFNHYLKELGSIDSLEVRGVFDCENQRLILGTGKIGEFSITGQASRNVTYDVSKITFTQRFNAPISREFFDMKDIRFVFSNKGQRVPLYIPKNDSFAIQLSSDQEVKWVELKGEYTYPELVAAYKGADSLLLRIWNNKYAQMIIILVLLLLIAKGR